MRFSASGPVQRIQRHQKYRGVDVGSGGFWQRAMNWVVESLGALSLVDAWERAVCAWPEASGPPLCRGH
jgi:hypothetical protein